MKRCLSLVLVVVMSSLALGACKEDDQPDARVAQPSLADAPVAPAPDAKPAATVDAGQTGG